jgi:hypothetical protein
VIAGLVVNEYPSGSSMSASVIICIVLLGLIPKIEPTLFALARILQVAARPGRPRAQDYLRAIRGLDDDKPKTLKEIGKKFGVTRERGRQKNAGLAYA